MKLMIDHRFFPRAFAGSGPMLFPWTAALGWVLAFSAPLYSQSGGAPTGLANWQVTGAAPVEGAGQSFTLPPGAEIKRTVDGEKVTVHLVSWPAFGETPHNWSTLEVGLASLTFLRDKSGGGVVLLGDVPLQLPFTIPLSADNRSLLPLDFNFVVDRSLQNVSVTLNNRNFVLPARMGAGPVQVYLSAAKDAGWRVESLDIQTVPNDASAAPPAAPVGSPVSPAPDPGVRSRDNANVIAKAGEAGRRAAEQKQNFTDALAWSKAGNPTKADEALLKGNRYLAGTAGWHIESASKLTHLALSLRQRYDARGAIATAQRALTLLKEAERLSAGAANRQKATVQEMAGFLHDEILRDAGAARAAYEKAQQIDRQSKRAKLALEQLAAADGKVQRISGGQKVGGGP